MTDTKEARVNRRTWIITGIITVFLILVVIFLLKDNADKPADMGEHIPAAGLSYCSEEQSKPCVVSFSVDADENMLVNLLLPETSFPAFHLKIARGESEIGYECQRVSTASNTAYCIGEKLPPGETLHLMLISNREEILLAEGDLSIIGLAFPTLEVVIPTSEILPTEPPAAPAPTEIPDFIIPTPTQTPIPTLPSYPNPSYPNPSYP